MLLVATDDRFAEHATGEHHPERPARLGAVLAGLSCAIAHDPDVARRLEPRRATDDELIRVHTAQHVSRLREFCASGGGHLDADTVASTRSWEAAQLAAGAGLAAVDALRAGAGEAAFLAVRPPGHHAVPTHSMGFCLLNNIAVTAAALAEAGERVVVLDWDAHHGNGTQEIFESDPRVMYVSLHQWPLYPGTGRVQERGRGDGIGTTCNLPLPPGATGDVYLGALDAVVEPFVEAFQPDWLLVSAGFDAHRDDPLTDLGLRAGDFADLMQRALSWVPLQRTIVFLEGGYDLAALEMSVAATVSTLIGDPIRLEPATSGGPGADVVQRLAQVHSPHS